MAETTGVPRRSCSLLLSLKLPVTRSFVNFFDDPLTPAQQLFGKESVGDLERQPTRPCAVGGLQQSHVFHSTLCAVNRGECSGPSALGSCGFGEQTDGTGFVIVVYQISVKAMKYTSQLLLLGNLLIDRSRKHDGHERVLDT